MFLFSHSNFGKYKYLLGIANYLQPKFNISNYHRYQLKVGI